MPSYRNDQYRSNHLFAWPRSSAGCGLAGTSRGTDEPALGVTAERAGKVRKTQAFDGLACVGGTAKSTVPCRWGS